MISLNSKTPFEMIQHLADSAQAKRLSLNMSQKTLSERSGVSYGVIKRFEQSGKISLESLLKIALVLNALHLFEPIFKKDEEEISSLDDLMKDNKRKRGRR